MSGFTVWQLRAWQLQVATAGALLCSALVAAGCNQSKIDQRAGAASSDEELQLAVPPGYKLRQLDAPAVRFSMPEALSLKVESFDPTLPAQKFRHELMLIDDQDIQVMIHVWDNPKHLEVQDWFELNMSGFITEHSSLRQTRVTPQRFPAVVLEEPASEQAASQELTVFATRDHVYSITCIDPVSNPPAKKLFDHVVESFAPLAKEDGAADVSPAEARP
ncbi:MAG: hypothetical protein H6718_07875 [Polyangiaceae bacterium]|nr:hypothetical protein [Myxococcales bacterium]MCB9585300.1 hypothetical protein [Polyangiaceae bacterium]MCB9606683.1 hypothetical protein [Polyangiaceae bacterium]